MSFELREDLRGGWRCPIVGGAWSLEVYKRWGARLSEVQGVSGVPFMVVFRWWHWWRPLDGSAGGG